MTDDDDMREWMFLLVPAHPGCLRQSPESHKTVVCVCVCGVGMDTIKVVAHTALGFLQCTL